eukprot:1835997-Rhodomonas_salina.3
MRRTVRTRCTTALPSSTPRDTTLLVAANAGSALHMAQQRRCSHEKGHCKANAGSATAASLADTARRMRSICDVTKSTTGNRLAGTEPAEFCYLAGISRIASFGAWPADMQRPDSVSRSSRTHVSTGHEKANGSGVGYVSNGQHRYTAVPDSTERTCVTHVRARQRTANAQGIGGGYRAAVPWQRKESTACRGQET